MNVIQSVKGHGFVPLNSVGGPLQKAVLPLIARVDDRWWPVGTAFVEIVEGQVQVQYNADEEWKPRDTI